MEEPRPGCPKCMQINQIEFYGQLFDAFRPLITNDDDPEESISIIGKVKRV